MFSGPKPKYRLCCLKLIGKEVEILGDQPPDSDDKKTYTAFVHRDYVGMAAGAVGSIVGRSILRRQNRVGILRRQNEVGEKEDLVVYDLSHKDYATLARLDAERLKQRTGTTVPEKSRALDNEEIVNRREKWTPPYLRFLKSSKSSKFPTPDREEWRSPYPDILDLGKPSDDTSES